MEEKVNFNRSLYNIFSVCADFRQRVEKLQRLSSAKRNKKSLKAVSKKK